ncbi:Hypothetical protein HVR_LOCUS148 [uncultured virus]|nr:Hypothetical protein HVR_LOCUS148 [uncultured virus]
MTSQYLTGIFDSPVHVKSIGKRTPAYGYELAWVFYKFDELSTSTDNIGIVIGNEVLPEVRDSKSLNEIKLMTCQQHKDRHLCENDELKSLYPLRYQSSHWQYKVQDLNKGLSYKLHGYEKGEHFAKHTDEKKSPRHFATLLIFPPAIVSSFEGGDLILYPTGSDPVVVQPSKFKRWSFVAFNIAVPHEFTPVTSGQEFVFKTDLELPEDNSFFLNPEANATVIPLTTETSVTYHQNKIRKLLRKALKHQAKIDVLNTGTETSKVTRFFSTIEQTRGDVCLVLATSSLSTNPDTLEGEEAMIWNKIVTKWPHSSLQVMKASHCKSGYDGKSSKTLKLGHNYIITETGNAKIFCWKSPENHKLGKLLGIHSERNDDTYDIYYDLEVAVICVQKQAFII